MRASASRRTAVAATAIVALIAASCVGMDASLDAATNGDSASTTLAATTKPATRRTAATRAAATTTTKAETSAAAVTTTTTTAAEAAATAATTTTTTATTKAATTAATTGAAVAAKPATTKSANIAAAATGAAPKTDAAAAAVTTATPGTAAAAAAASDPSLAALAASVTRLAQTSAQLENDVVTLKSSNERLLKELQAVQAQAKADVARLQSDAAAERRSLEGRLQSADALAKSLARQVSTQQLFAEERIRSDGHSGIKRNRNGRVGTKAYISGSVVGGGSVLSVHDHSNYDRTVGLGEFIGVLNGVEFRTRHNDYKLVMPSTVSQAYQATENIPFPEVPPEVLAKKTVKEQIDEMREFFKAWKFQNPKLRNYSKYFRPVLCYLEGSWTQSSAKIDEPFQSDRHAIDASSWFDLQDKISFTSYTGRKSSSENYAFLPTAIVDFTNETVPIYAQWNYRILCHPVSFDVPFKAMQAIDDVATRLKLGLPYQQLQTSRSARYVVGPDGNWNGDGKGLDYGSLLDQMMREIPGLNNYGANITDDAQYTLSMEPGRAGQRLNAAYYHRYAAMGRDAMGLSMQTKGFTDANLYVALTTQAKVAAKTIQSCFNRTTCKTFSQRVSYAIPLEVIYVTPLQSWNPYKLARHDRPTVVTGNGKRNGKKTLDQAFNGTSTAYSYLTPEEFFYGGEVERNPADTASSSVAVLDPSGLMHNVSASGIRVHFPNIPGVGVLRQRYPIFPVHEEGSHAYQQLEALKEMLMDQQKYAHLYRNPMSMKPGFAPNTNATRGITLVTSVASFPSPHEHLVELDADEVEVLDAGGVVQQFTSQAGGHTHWLQIKSVMANRSKVRTYSIVQCDGKAPPCWDGHETLQEGSN